MPVNEKNAPKIREILTKGPDIEMSFRPGSLPTPTDTNLRIGDAVTLHNLEREEFDGKHGTLVEWLKGDERWTVQLKDGSLTAVRPTCVKLKRGRRRRLAHEACHCCPPVVPSILTGSTTEEAMTPSERVLHRRRLAHGVRTPVVLATLMEDIEEAKRNWISLRR